MKPICDATFVAQMKRLPVGWKQPQAPLVADQYQRAFQTYHHMTIPEPGCYFWTQSTLKRHTDSCRHLGTIFKDFCHDMLDGIDKAVDVWRAQAMLQNLTIMGPLATGNPGCLMGPNLESLIKMFSIPTASGLMKKWRDAVAAGVADCWSAWQTGLSVPSIPMYPAFALWPGPFAPPMPNVATPLIAFPSSGMKQMSPLKLKDAMVQAFKETDNDGQFAAMAISIGTAVSVAFMAWLSIQQAISVLGYGPVPTFSPPVVVVGPVVGGSNVASPGHFAV